MQGPEGRVLFRGARGALRTPPPCVMAACPSTCLPQEPRPTLLRLSSPFHHPLTLGIKDGASVPQAPSALCASAVGMQDGHLKFRLPLSAASSDGTEPVPQLAVPLRSQLALTLPLPGEASSGVFFLLLQDAKQCTQLQQTLVHPELSSHVSFLGDSSSANCHASVFRETWHPPVPFSPPLTSLPLPDPLVSHH